MKKPDQLRKQAREQHLSGNTKDAIIPDHSVGHYCILSYDLLIILLVIIVLCPMIYWSFWCKLEIEKYGTKLQATRGVPLLEHEHLSFRTTRVHPRILVGLRCSIFSFICMFCRSLFVLWLFFFWPFYCLSFFDLWTLVTPLVSFLLLQLLIANTLGRIYLRNRSKSTCMFIKQQIKSYRSYIQFH